MTAHMPDNQEPEHSQQVQGSAPAQYQGPDAAGHFAGNVYSVPLVAPLRRHYPKMPFTAELQLCC
jgi:hypothetical protein